MLRIRKQREAASGQVAAPGWARTGSPSAAVATFAPGAGAAREAAFIEGAPGNSRLAAQGLTQGFVNRQLLI
jgi:hypothetical protein